MAEKEPSNIAQQKSDVESTTIYSEELRPKKSMKCLAYVAAFAVFLTVIIILFSLTIMRVRDPKHRLSSIGVEGIIFNSSTASPSFSMRFDAAVAVKNTNFGQFKFDNSTIKLAYKGTNVGEAIIAKAQARARSTKRIEVLVGVSSNNVSSNSALASDINTGIFDTNQPCQVGWEEPTTIAEKDQQVHPMEPTTAEPKTDVGSASVQSEELRRRKKGMKCLAYVAAFAIFLTAIILALAVTVMNIKNPKFRLHSIDVEDLSFSPSTTPPSFSMRLDAELAVKNTNFGHYKYENSTITLAYRGTKVGEALISKGRARARSTKEIEVTVDVTSSNASSNSNLASDLNSGILTLTSHGELSGKVHLIEVIKKKKAPQMNCNINIDMVKKEIQDWNCN
ncbi:Late embryogenesis abundant protein [Vitis vinifera]|uniref:Late embryogenesis abundant protein n=1 Tax=Vitis vinifera TaxID=29760 RepID=A0A438G7B5_VITVI|nr:Late embryogenesis abundant protein [Vitis vinifera]